jgi:hypothetical protein
MTFRHTLAVLATTAVLPLGATLAQATPLSSLVGGSTLTEGDVTFSGFFFDDRFGDDVTGTEPDRQNATFPGDRSVDASEVTITTSSTASSVTLTATIDPGISIAEAADPDLFLENIFDFFLDFDVSIAAGSSRTITALRLGGGDLFATGAGLSEVIYDVLGFGGGSDLEIFEAPGLTPFSQTTDAVGIPAVTALGLAGQIEGETLSGATAGLSTFSLTFDLEGTAPPPPIDGVVPVPPALPLALSAFAGFALLRRARRG